MSDKVLVAYATRYGSTTGIAETIGGALRAEGLEVDIITANDVVDVTQYNMVIIGSPLIAGKWLPEAFNMVKKHRDALKRIPVAFFSVGMKLVDDTDENRNEMLAATDSVCEMIRPVDIGLFAGKLDLKKLSFPVRAMIRLMKVPVGDFRNEEAIKKWAKGLKEKKG